MSLPNIPSNTPDQVQKYVVSVKRFSDKDFREKVRDEYRRTLLPLSQRIASCVSLPEFDGLCREVTVALRRPWLVRLKNAQRFMTF